MRFTGEARNSGTEKQAIIETHDDGHTYDLSISCVEGAKVWLDGETAREMARAILNQKKLKYSEKDIVDMIWAIPVSEWEWSDKKYDFRASHKGVSVAVFDNENIFVSYGTTWYKQYRAKGFYNRLAGELGTPNRREEVLEQDMARELNKWTSS